MAETIDLHDPEAVIQRVRFELYRDNLAGAMRLLADAAAVAPDRRYQTYRARLEAATAHLASSQAYTRAYEAFYRATRGGFTLKHLERALRMWLGRRARSVVRHVSADPEFALLEREVLAVGASRVLDAGCGEGRVAMTLAARHPSVQVAGIEISRTNLRLARETNRASNAKFHEGLLEEADRIFAPGTFDLVYAFAVLEHVRDVDQAVAAMRRMLRPGGRLCFVVPMNEFDLCGPLPEFEHEGGVAGHVRLFTEAGLRERFGDLPGFTLVKLPGEVPARYPASLVPREFGSFFVAFSK